MPIVTLLLLVLRTMRKRRSSNEDGGGRMPDCNRTIFGAPVSDSIVTAPQLAN